jgi:hypothetical protein
VLLHRPFAHTWPAAQDVVQLPQWRGSLRVSTQPLVHKVVPERHVHRPPAQLSRAPQLRPQVPQLLGSELGSTHSPQSSSEPEQSHFPALQLAFDSHATAQAPQCAASLPRLTQARSQALSGAGHVVPHFPSAHT